MAHSCPVGMYFFPLQLEKRDKDYHLPAQTIYQELTFRKKFDKTKPNEDEFLRIVDDSWETYTSIFQHESQKVKYHPIMIWEFLENFLYQFSQYHFRQSTLSPEKLNAEWFNYKKTL